jgi:uncharacterized membrane protein
MLFIKGFIVGIGKIIPGVSGAMLALNFHLYEKLIDSITSFYKKPKENSIFLLTFGLGALISIIFFSNIILFLLINYRFITMMFFLGLITGGTYNYNCNAISDMSNYTENGGNVVLNDKGVIQTVCSYVDAAGTAKN